MVDNTFLIKPDKYDIEKLGKFLGVEHSHERINKIYERFSKKHKEDTIKKRFVEGPVEYSYVKEFNSFIRNIKLLLELKKNYQGITNSFLILLEYLEKLDLDSLESDRTKNDFIEKLNYNFGLSISVHKQSEELEERSKEFSLEKSAIKPTIEKTLKLYQENQEEHRKSYKRDFNLMILVSSFTIIYSFFTYDSVIENLLILNFKIALPPLLVILIFFYLLKFFADEYKSNKHYFLEYEFRITTIKLFQNLLANKNLSEERYFEVFKRILDKTIDIPHSPYLKSGEQITNNLGNLTS